MRQIVERELRHSAPLQTIDRLGASAELAPLPGLHLDEHQCRSIAGDDVKFAAAPAVPARNYCVPAALQFLTREIFADLTQRHSGARHRSTREQRSGQITTVTAET